MPAELRYAATLSSDFTATLVFALTLALMSAEVAFLVHTRPRLAEPSLDCSRVQPAGPVRVPLLELLVMNSSRVSPAATVAGTRTVCVVPVGAMLADATYVSVGAAALADGRGPRAATASVATTVAERSAVTLRPPREAP